ncbi:dihydroorotase [Ferruginibacter sp. SUN106]|uniref:dihydroorotase n=1 Tax=Ferruginibacter sp. SUN106 TaxID=2978348 RepID=UPI003D35FA3A
MKVLIKQARIISPASPFNGQTKDILIHEGSILKISDAINEPADQVIDQPGLCASIGWMDIFANFGDPGHEYKETLETGARAAAAGGFTDVLVLPNTSPVVHNKSQVEYVIQKSRTLAVNIRPIGAVTKNAEGKELAEMYDMHQSGAAAFGDGTNPIQSAGIVLKALQYVKSFDGTVIQIPEDKSIGANGLMNEGIISTQLGLPGKPVIAEEILIARDLKLARYAESKLHFTGVSSAKSLEYIKRAKEGGTTVSCSVTPYHLYFTDTDMQEYDTNLKVNPPLRTTKDKEALLKAVADGTVDCIASHHFPQNWDGKTCEFEYAKEGMIGLETLFGVMGNFELGTEKLIELLSVNPRKIFGIAIPEIKEGAVACLTLFNATTEYIFEAQMIQSKSKNSPFVGKKLKGKVIGIINKGKVELNQA